MVLDLLYYNMIVGAYTTTILLNVASTDLKILRKTFGHTSRTLTRERQETGMITFKLNTTS
jgi:hypothetical protein